MSKDSSYDFAPEEKSPDGKPAKPVSPIAAENLQERTCPHCGFKSYGKPRSRCPECAAPVSEITVDMLQFAPTSWLRPTANGFMLIFLAIIIHLTAASLRTILVGTYRADLHLAGEFLMLIAVFISTRSEPGRPIAPLPTGTIARFAALGSFLFWIFLVLIANKIYFTRDHIKFFILMSLLCQTVLAGTLCVHIAHLAARVPNDSLAAHAYNAAWIASAACLLLIIVHALDTVGSDILFITFFIGIPIIAFEFAIFLWTLTILFRTSADLRGAATAADSIVYRRTAREAATKPKNTPKFN